MDGSLMQQHITIVVAALVLHSGAPKSLNNSRNHNFTSPRDETQQKTYSFLNESLTVSSLHQCGLDTEKTEEACGRFEINETYPAAQPENVSSSYHCEHALKNACYTIIKWRQPMTQGEQRVRGYRIRIYNWNYEKHPNNALLFCCKLPATTRFINITLTKIPLHVLLRGLYAILGAQPVKQTPGYQKLSGPKEIVIKPPLPYNQKVKESARFVFTCRFTGEPLPNAKDVRWLHNEIPVSNDDRRYHIVSKDRSSSLIILHMSQRHIGRYKCIVSSFFGDRFNVISDGSISGLYPRQPETTRKERQYIIIGVLSLCVLIVVIALYGVRLYKNKGHMDRIRNNLSEIRTQTVYLSHCTHGERETEDLLKFTYRLENRFPNISVIIDLTRQTEISQSGGLAQWIHKRLAEAHKILVVLSEEYLDALNLEDDVAKDFEQVLKVRTEYRFIESLLYQDFQVADKLIVAWQKVKDKEELPPLLQGRRAYTLPQRKTSFEGSTFIDLFTTENVS